MPAAKTPRDIETRLFINGEVRNDSIQLKQDRPDVSTVRRIIRQKDV